MKVLITGGKGTIGRHTESILNKDYEIFSTDIVNVLKNNYLDIRDYDSILEKIKKVNPDLILHLAAKAGSTEGGGSAISKKNPYNYLMTNITGIINLLEGCRTLEVNKFIFMSSFSTYGETTETIKESTKQNPKNPYGVSKLSSELILKTYTRNYDIKGLIFRAPLVVGKKQNELNAMNEFIDCALNDEDLIIYGDGNHIREWLYADDVGEAYKKGIKYLNKMSSNIEDLNLGNPLARVSMKDLAKMIISKVNQGKIVYKRKGINTWNQLTHIGKIKKELNWKPEYNLNEILDIIIEDRKDEK